MHAIDNVTKTILCAKRRSFLRSRPVYECVAPTSEAELYRLARGMNFRFSVSLAKWLRVAGYGDIDGTLRFREDCFSVIDRDPLAGHVSFAQDTLGNCYAFDPKGGGICCYRTSDQRVICVADNFSSFLQELVRRDYKLQEWLATLPTRK